MHLDVIRWDSPGAPDEETLRRQLLDEGFEVFRWRDEAGADYAPHAHAHDESLWVVEGALHFGAGGHDLVLQPGDRLMLPRGTIHTARAGAAGATYLIGERA